MTVTAMLSLVALLFPSFTYVTEGPLPVIVPCSGRAQVYVSEALAGVTVTEIVEAPP